jgi:hypothetical protein
MSKRIQLGKVDLFMGTTDHWGLGFDYTPGERAFVIDFIHWYFGIEPHWEPTTYEPEEFIDYLEVLGKKNADRAE